MDKSLVRYSLRHAQGMFDFILRDFPPQSSVTQMARGLHFLCTAISQSLDDPTRRISTVTFDRASAHITEAGRTAAKKGDETYLLFTGLMHLQGAIKTICTSLADKPINKSFH